MSGDASKVLGEASGLMGDSDPVAEPTSNYPPWLMELINGTVGGEVAPAVSTASVYSDRPQVGLSELGSVYGDVKDRNAEPAAGGGYRTDTGLYDFPETSAGIAQARVVKDAQEANTWAPRDPRGIGGGSWSRAIGKNSSDKDI